MTPDEMIKWMEGGVINASEFTESQIMGQTYLSAEASTLFHGRGYRTEFTVRYGVLDILFTYHHTVKDAEGDVQWWEYRSRVSPTVVRVFND